MSISHLFLFVFLTSGSTLANDILNPQPRVKKFTLNCGTNPKIGQDCGSIYWERSPTEYLSTRGAEAEFFKFEAYTRRFTVAKELIPGKTNYWFNVAVNYEYTRDERGWYQTNNVYNIVNIRMA